MKFLSPIILAFILTGCQKPNSELTYGETGLPKNCRAVIKTNIDEYQKTKHIMKDTESMLKSEYRNDSYEYRGQAIENYVSTLNDIDGIFDSINRNCGEHGYAWENN